MDFYVRIYALVLLQENQIDTCLYKTIADRYGKRSFPISHIPSFLALYLSCGQLQSFGSILSSAQLFDSLIKHVSWDFRQIIIIFFKNLGHIINHGNHYSLVYLPLFEIYILIIQINMLRT